MSSLEPRFDAQFCPSRHFTGAPCDRQPPHIGHAHESWLIEAGRRVRVLWVHFLPRRRG